MKPNYSIEVLKDKLRFYQNEIKKETVNSQIVATPLNLAIIADYKRKIADLESSIQLLEEVK